MTTPTDRADGPQIGPEEIAQILQAFAGSSWAGMQLRVGEVTVSAGKDAPPPVAVSTPVPAAPTAPAAGTSDTPEQASQTSAAAPARASTPTVPAPPVAAPPAASGPASDLDETGLVSVTSPTVGSFWIAPDPGSPPFVEVGARVEAGDQLAIVEVMKLMSPIITEVGGEVVAVRAQNAEMVEFGQTLFLVRPDE